MSQNSYRHGYIFSVILCLALLSGCSGKKHYSLSQKVSAFTIGTIALQVGSDQAAGKTGYDEKYLTLASKMVPGEPAVWGNLGLMYLRRGDYTLASTDLHKAEKLDSTSARIQELLGLLDDQQGNIQHAIQHYQNAVNLDNNDLQAHYSLANEEGRLGTQQGYALQETQLQTILNVQPDNLFVILELAHAAAVLKDTSTLHKMIELLQAREQTFTPDAVQELGAVNSDLNSHNFAQAGIDTRFLQNVLKRNSDYGIGSLALQGDVASGLIGEPIQKFLKTENPASTPSPPDMGLTWKQTDLSDNQVHAKWAGSIWLNGEGKTEALWCDGVHLQSADKVVNADYPGGPQHQVSSTNSILAVDFDFTLKNDIVMAGPGGIKFYLQKPNGTGFEDVTSTTHLSSTILNGDYFGVWQADLNADGDIDLIVAPETGAPFELQNNGNGTFSPRYPFKGVMNVRGFSWVDLENEGNPDACFLDSTGKIHVFTNLRSGIFQQRPSIPNMPEVVSINCGAVNSTGQLDILALTSAGSVMAIGNSNNNTQFISQTLVSGIDLPANLSPGSPMLLTGDIDNNGGSDLIISWKNNWQAWLCNSSYQFQPLPVQSGNVTTVMDLSGNGMLDLTGLDSTGTPIEWATQSTKNYHWQELRPQPAKEEFQRSDYFTNNNTPLSGNRRINSFGIGGEMEARCGLLYQKQMMEGAVVHFGIGTYKRLDAVRIVWPNGDTRALFGDVLKPDMSVVSLHFLKGSCPYLFVWNGRKFVFVTDCIWRSPLGLKIDAQQTAGLGQTTDWVKIPGSMMVPRNGHYSLRITAELWETHFFDQLGLMAVDHPAGTGVWVDERFCVPPPPHAIYPTGPLMPVAKATDDLGNNVTSILSHRDGRYLNSFGLGKYQGITRYHYVQLNLSNAPVNKPLWLVCQGWIHPTDSSINVAYGLTHYSKPQALSLWTPNREGKWILRKKDLGFPEGKVKTILINLKGVFQPGAPREIRLATNLEIYWDAIRWATSLPNTPLKVTRLDFEKATLDYRGFSVLHSADPYSPELPLGYHQILTRSPRWRDLVGYYTRYGNVLPLLTKKDDRYVIMNAGDELRLRFRALPPPKKGWVRDFVLIGNGWVKDGDYNTSFSRTVLPLPSHSQTAYNTPPTHLWNDPVYQKHRSDWLKYQTRWVEPKQFMKGLRP